MKAVEAAFNQEKALVGAFSVITNLQMQCGCNFFKHYRGDTGHYCGDPWSPVHQAAIIRNLLSCSAVAVCGF